jgi:hypothetical protein
MVVCFPCYILYQHTYTQQRNVVFWYSILYFHYYTPNLFCGLRLAFSFWNLYFIYFPRKFNFFYFKVFYLFIWHKLIIELHRSQLKKKREISSYSINERANKYYLFSLIFIIKTVIVVVSIIYERAC